ncbi:hypothetical protein LXL04_029476 [Taraxacum kok-saghyz]
MIEPRAPRKRPSELYGGDNTTDFTMCLAHGGDFAYFPGRSHSKVQIVYITHIDTIELDLGMLERFSRKLQYSHVGRWLYLSSQTHHGLQMLPLTSDSDFAAFKRDARFYCSEGYDLGGDKGGRGDGCGEHACRKVVCVLWLGR